MYRVIAADMDDTLLDASSKLTQRTLNALRRAMDAGAKVVIASGRMLESTRPFAEQIGVNAPLVIYNGAVVYDLANEKALSSRMIAMDTARAICRLAEENGIYIQAFPGQNYYAAAHTEYTDMYSKSVGVDCVFTGVPLSEWLSSDVVKLLMIGEKSQTARRLEIFGKAFPDISFMMSRPNYVEVVSKGVDKQFALESALEILGIPAEEMLAFGDGQNDISMLNMAGRGYCMANASGGVKAACKYFAPANTDDGVARVIEVLLDAGEIGG